MAGYIYNKTLNFIEREKKLINFLTNKVLSYLYTCIWPKKDRRHHFCPRASTSM